MPLTAEREANSNPAYLLGRIFAEMEALEVAATGDDTHGDTCLAKMAQASANPAVTLAIHARYGAGWDRRLRARGRVRLADELADRIAALSARIEPGVRPAGSEASSWWALGYWHQRVADDGAAEPAAA